MSKTISKTIRFSDKEYKVIESKLNEYSLDFSAYARGTLLKKKINFPYKLELLYHLNNIQLDLNGIAKKVHGNDKRLILLQLFEIEKKLNEFL